MPYESGLLVPILKYYLFLFVLNLIHCNILTLLYFYGNPMSC